MEVGIEAAIQQVHGGQLNAEAALRPAWRAPLLVLAALHFAFHAISHGVDVTRADPEWVGPVEFAGLLGGAALLLLLARRALAESGDPRGRGSA